MRISALTLVALTGGEEKTVTLGTDERKQRAEERIRSQTKKIKESFRKELNILGLADSARFCEGGENRKLDQSKEFAGGDEGQGKERRPPSVELLFKATQVKNGV